MTPLITHGNKFCAAQVGSGPAADFIRRAHEIGAPLAGSFGMDNMGLAIDARPFVPVTLGRRVLGETEACPGMDARPSDDTLRAMAAAQIDYYVHHMNAAERQATDKIIPWNEPAPEFDHGWLALTRLQFFTADACEAAGFKFLAFAFNAGGPQYDTMLAILATGIMARLTAGGHGWAKHSGVLGVPGTPDALVDRMEDAILGTAIHNRVTGVSSPYLADADMLILRHRFDAAAARQVGVTLAPLWITEFYPTLKPIKNYPLEEILRRYKWLDGELAKDSYVMGVCPYAIGHSGVGLPDGDQTPVWPGLVDYGLTVAQRANATTVATDGRQARARALAGELGGLL